MIINIDTNGGDPKVTFSFTAQEYEDYKRILQQVYPGLLTKPQQLLLNQITRNLDRLKFKPQ